MIEIGFALQIGLMDHRLCDRYTPESEPLKALDANNNHGFDRKITAEACVSRIQYWLGAELSDIEVDVRK